MNTGLSWRPGPLVRVLTLIVCAVLVPCGSAAAQAGPPFVVLLVTASHLDYTDQAKLIRQLHKRSQFKQGFMGHSWVYLEGEEAGRRQVYDAGVSPAGEGATQFIRAVLNLSRYGYADPSETQREHPHPDPNPIAYLWKDQGNGYLQPAAVPKLTPTYAARVDLTQEQFRAIRALMDPGLPRHHHFQLTGHQCTAFVVEVAALAGIRLEHRLTIAVPSQIRVGGETYRLWTDPAYARLTLASPDVLEQSLERLVAQGRASDVTQWYRHSH